MNRFQSMEFSGIHIITPRIRKNETPEATMRIAIIGTGNVGHALARALERAGHAIVFGTRTPDPSSAQQVTIAKASADAHATILAVPFGAAQDVITAGGGFAGKIVIDATNPLGMGSRGLGLTMGFTTSGGETIAAMAPNAKLFKTFNQTGFENMADAIAYKNRPVMFVAGDDATAKPLVMGLVTDAGFEALDAGDLAESRLLEAYAMLWIELARKRRLGSDFTFTLQRKA
jgi:predicted dinucleotide-binding enzyme